MRVKLVRKPRPHTDSGGTARDLRDREVRKEIARSTAPRTVQESGVGGGLLGAAKTVAGDVAQIGEGVAGLFKDYGEALYGDLTTMELEAPFKRTRKQLAKDATGLLAAYENAIPEPSWLPDWMRRDIIVVDPEAGTIKRGSGKIDPNDSARAAKFWRDDPVIGALLFAPPGTAISKSASRAALKRGFMKVNPEMPAREAARLARKESRLPGYAAAQGIEGGIGPRVLKGEAGEAIGRPWSQNPVGRAAQRGFDSFSEFLELTRGPGSKFSTSQRAARAKERSLRKETARERAAIALLEREIRKASPFGFRRGDARVHEALVAALEAPKALTPRQAVEIKIADMNRTLPSVTDEAIKRRFERRIRDLQRSLEGDRLESKSFQKALDALETLSARAEESAARVLGYTPEQLAQRRNIVAERWAEAGWLPEGVAAEARGYFPHRSEFEYIGSGMSGPTGPVGSVVGRPEPGRAFERRQNELKLYERGEVQASPRALGDTARKRARFEINHEARSWLWEHGQPINAGDPIPEGTMIVRNPDAASRSIPHEVRAAIENPTAYAETVNAPAFNRWLETWLYRGEGVQPEWVSDVKNIRVVPEGVVRTLLSDAFASAPRGSFASVVGALNATVRATTIYLPYGGTRYVARNTPQNIILLALTKPRAFLQLRKSTATLRRKERDIYEAIKVEAGTVPAAAGLPELPGRKRTAAQRVEGKLTDASRKVASGLSEVSDEPWRVASWLEYARQYGFGTREGRTKLLTSDDPAIVRVRDDISQRVREDMIDFDALPPWARENLSRYLFIVPFVYGAGKWPAVYFREYPFRASLQALVAAQHADDDDPLPQSVREMGRIGDLDLGWLSPIQPALESAERGVAAARGLPEGDLSAVAEFLAPQLREAVEAGAGRGDPEALGRVLIPGYTTADRIGRGGSIAEQVLRALGTSVEVPEFRVRQRDESRAKLVAAWELVGKDPGEAEKVARAERAYQAWKDIEARAGFAAGDQGRDLSAREEAELLTELAIDWYPEVAEQLPSPEQLEAAEDYSRYLRAIQDYMFGPRHRLLARATRERNKEE